MRAGARRTLTPGWINPRPIYSPRTGNASLGCGQDLGPMTGMRRLPEQLDLTGHKMVALTASAAEFGGSHRRDRSARIGDPQRLT
jgi:hypothetical protein